MKKFWQYAWGTLCVVQFIFVTKGIFVTGEINTPRITLLLVFIALYEIEEISGKLNK
jgi:hypothetical protein